MPLSLPPPRCSGSGAGKETIQNHSWFWQYINLSQKAGFFGQGFGVQTLDQTGGNSLLFSPVLMTQRGTGLVNSRTLP